MSRPAELRPFPRGPLIGATALVVMALASTVFVRVTSSAIPEPEPNIIAARDLRFEDRPDGSVAILDVQEGRSLESVLPGTNGFLRATLRGLARERRLRGIGDDTPFHLCEQSDGRLILSNPTTSRRVYLDAFGPTNAGAFARLLPARKASR